jgi:RNA polymerase sigma factor (sigma-70 family)
MNRKNRNRRKMTDKELEEITAKYTPLVLSLARKYQGRGAEYDDLVQEGYIALIKLAPRCSNPDRMSLFLKRQLPAKVRNAAARLRRKESLESELEDGELEVSSPLGIMPWLLESLMTDLEGNEREILKLLAFGYLQKEIAERLGITQQAVSSRVGRIRKKIATPSK